MLSYGYIPRGYNQFWTARMTELRNACVAKAHELGMGIVAMKVDRRRHARRLVGIHCAGIRQETPQQLPAAAIRYVLQDKRIHVLNIGMRLKEEIDANIKILSGDLTYTLDDRALLARVLCQAYDSDAIKAMRID